MKYNVTSKKVDRTFLLTMFYRVNISMWMVEAVNVLCMESIIYACRINDSCDRIWNIYYWRIFTSKVLVLQDVNINMWWEDNTCLLNRCFFLKIIYVVFWHPFLLLDKFLVLLNDAHICVLFTWKLTFDMITSFV